MIFSPPHSSQTVSFHRRTVIVLYLSIGCETTPPQCSYSGKVPMITPLSRLSCFLFLQEEEHCVYICRCHSLSKCYLCNLCNSNRCVLFAVRCVKIYLEEGKKICSQVLGIQTQVNIFTCVSFRFHRLVQV